MVVGASGGGLAAGISLGVKARVPSAKFYTVEPEGFDDTLRSFASGKREANARMSGTICDALMAAQPGELTFAVNRALLAGGLEGWRQSEGELFRDQIDLGDILDGQESQG